MPMPGENISAVEELIHNSIDLLEHHGDEDVSREKVRNNIAKAERILQDEEMNVLRFGDVTRIADDSFEPYQSIKKALEFISEFELSDYVPVKDEEEDKESEAENALSAIIEEDNVDDAIETLYGASEAIEVITSKEDFPEVY